jgi:hypothetical protein
MITTVAQMITQYVESWNGAGLSEFKAGFAQCWDENAMYTDPDFERISGVNELAELAQKSLELYPGRIFHILAMPDHHHNVGRYAWMVDLPGETREGFDYFEFNEAFKITRIVSFFGPLK